MRGDKINKRPFLDPQKLSQIKALVFSTAGTQFSEADFEVKWGKAVVSLQNRIKNMRSGAVRSATSSQLGQMDPSLM